MTINERKQGDITILELQGRLDATSTLDVDKRLSKLFDGGVLQLVFDLSGLEYVSSSGLRVILSAAKRMKQVHGKLALGSPSLQVQQVFDVAGLSTILPIFANMAQAIGSFTAGDARSEAAKAVRIKLTVAEEIYLLALDDSLGVIKAIPVFALDYALASALLMELALCDRIDTDLTTLKVISTEPTGDPLLDDTLLELQQKAEPQPTLYWLEQLIAHKRQIGERVLAQLLQKGVLKQENRRILWMFETHRYPLMDDREVKEVRTRLRELILGDDIPDSRDVVLVSLGKACHLLDDLFTPKEREMAHDRIDAIARLDLIGHEMANSIREVERAITLTSMAPI